MKKLHSLLWTTLPDPAGRRVTVEVFYDLDWIRRMAEKAVKAKGRKCCYGPIKAIARRPKR